MKTLPKIIGALLLGLGVAVVSCKKKETFDPVPFQEAAEDNARVEGEQNFIGAVS